MLLIGLHALKDEVLARMATVSGTVALMNYQNQGSFDAYSGCKINTNWAFQMPSDSPQSIFIGGAGNSSAYGVRNFGLGYQSLYSLTTGTQNIGIGYQALYTLTSGTSNVAIGTSSLFYCTNSLNCAIGYQALQNVANATSNTAIGYRAGFTITTGIRNTFIGGGTDAAANNLNYAIAIGYNVKAPESNTCMMGGTGAYAVNLLLGVYENGMTAGGSIAIGNDLAHRGTKAGFFAKTPIIQPTLSSGSSITANDVAATLQSLGLCKES
jgi:hypothetical protein